MYPLSEGYSLFGNRPLEKVKAREVDHSSSEFKNDQFSTISQRAIRGAYSLYKYHKNLLTTIRQDEPVKDISERTAKTIRGVDRWEKEQMKRWRRGKRIKILEQKDGEITDFILCLRRSSAPRLTARFIIKAFPEAVAAGFSMADAKALTGGAY